MTTYIARGHGGDGGDQPPHGDPKRLLKGCESCKLVVRVKYEYFDLDSLRNTDQWEGIRLGIHAECQRAYKDRKQEFKKHFDSVGGYEDVEKERTKPPEELDQ
ncbi:hypothetical protein R6Q57_008815 [Mikania cordata]